MRWMLFVLALPLWALNALYYWPTIAASWQTALISDGVAGAAWGKNGGINVDTVRRKL